MLVYTFETYAGMHEPRNLVGVNADKRVGEEMAAKWDTRFEDFIMTEWDAAKGKATQVWTWTQWEGAEAKCVHAVIAEG